MWKKARGGLIRFVVYPYEIKKRCHGKDEG